MKSSVKSRRDMQNYEFARLSNLLPLPGAVKSQVDRSTVLSLVTTHLKLGNALDLYLKGNNNVFILVSHSYSVEIFRNLLKPIKIKTRPNNKG